MKEQLEQAKQLLQQQQFHKARAILKKLDHPKRDEWLKRVDDLEQKAKLSADNGIPPAVKSPVLTESPKPAPVLSKKPLPLLPEEEREMLPRGRPYDPQDILRGDHIIPSRLRARMMIFGGYSGPLIINYLRMNRNLLFVIALAYYIFTFFAAMFGFAFVYVFILQQQINIGIIALSILGMLSMPTSPYVIAWVQQEHYEEWKKEHEQMLRDFHNRQNQS